MSPAAAPKAGRKTGRQTGRKTRDKQTEKLINHIGRDSERQTEIDWTRPDHQQKKQFSKPFRLKQFLLKNGLLNQFDAQ